MRRRDISFALAANFLLGACAGGATDERAALEPKKPTAAANVKVLQEQLTIPGLNRQRTIRLYLPPSYDQNPLHRYPVIYMHDGQNLFDDTTSYVGEWGVDETMNDLARTHGFEVVVVGIDHGGDKRMTELNPWDHARYGAGEGEAYVRFIVEVLKPFIDARYRTATDASSTAIIGSSMGGLISHYAAHRYPQVFSKVGVFSPAYWVGPRMYKFAEENPMPASARLYLYMGEGEGRDMVKGAERMRDQLATSASPKAEMAFHLAAGAPHNETAWRKELPTALIWLFSLTATAT